MEVLLDPDIVLLLFLVFFCIRQLLYSWIRDRFFRRVHIQLVFDLGTNGSLLIPIFLKL